MDFVAVERFGRPNRGREIGRGRTFASRIDRDGRSVPIRDSGQSRRVPFCPCVPRGWFFLSRYDAIMDEEVQEEQLLAEEEDGMEQLLAEEGLEAAQLVPEESIAIPTSPITRSRTKALNQVIAKVLSCLSQQETKPTTLVCLEALHMG
ncbi:unnamed protein product [Microthlaspi erraticum]|uniref:Uncharacterized protein n=1 Tax=Microthlaspi erraticum TaxID=1685480 RepID=A0A6D2JJT7_9BRAS|nr:unnamed protein product [Microthlaspi erraticum]